MLNILLSECKWLVLVECFIKPRGLQSASHHSHLVIHTLIVANFWVVTTVALGQSDRGKAAMQLPASMLPGAQGRQSRN